MTPDERAAIRARAEAATPGPWEVDGYLGRITTTTDDSLVVDGITMWAETDAQHIAGMDPATTLLLLDERDALEYEAGLRDQLIASLEAKVARVEAQADALDELAGQSLSDSTDLRLGARSIRAALRGES